MSDCDVLVVGGGPAGLAAAITLRRLGIGTVTVAEREPQAGGIPRHCWHTGYGLRDLRRLTTGPQYAAHYRRLAERAGVQILTETTITGWAEPTRVQVTSPVGVTEIEAGAVVLATGCRERPRTARLVPGTRPQGVFTTGALQQFVYLHRLPVGRRALIVGAEHVSFSALHTLAHAGTEIAAMVTEHAADQTYRLLRLVTAGRYRVPVLTGQAVTGLAGRDRLEAAEVTDLRTGAARRIACDTIVFTGDWIPDHELARLGGLRMDSGTRGPWTGPAQRTSVRGVFAAGNLLHAAETADTAALCGRYVARPVAEFLRSGEWPDTAPLAIECEPPLAWISPSVVPAGDGADERLAHGHFIARVAAVLDRPLLQLRQDGRVLWSRRYRRLRPAMPVRIPARWTGRADPGGGPVRLTLG
jgi:thioredoxin reductase